MRERMEKMQHQIQDFVHSIQHEVLARASAAADRPRVAFALRDTAGGEFVETERLSRYLRSRLSRTENPKPS